MHADLEDRDDACTMATFGRCWSFTRPRNCASAGSSNCRDRTSFLDHSHFVTGRLTPFLPLAKPGCCSWKRPPIGGSWCLSDHGRAWFPSFIGVFASSWLGKALPQIWCTLLKSGEAARQFCPLWIGVPWASAILLPSMLQTP